ncbi:ABC transporter ATP-binding protein [Prosthecochloris sp. N3]|uniref:ABC transporter ATP-binding protein n=1 Tax=Prosthecochloris ethylica TaxID=2743976 RepID=A0ABR9XPV4_9CHLB|nr:ABC transporter ATP-binding protein [Prosthecochloris ethylica]MBF0587249.1 ABC transporter ATP-binding protein [Prosthecochloris ethylica]MBF0636057.1 ABC transporter ATP-binding protein [Prosthecochloris ethylica]NUK48484.1 ABC transporter ATP-binding protein [Prosthecochloris ethylica]
MRLEIKNLSKTYSNGVKAIQDVNLSIGRGMFGLLGENGAGKSTLMRTIATLQEADEGSVVFDGIDIARDPVSLRKVLGYLPQEFGVYPALTAEEFLLHIADMKGIAKASERKGQVEALLKRVNLWEDRKKKLGGYSGGMKQRFGIAQALLGEPRLIIVDEPTAGLDPRERNRFYNLLSEIGENTVVILSTHIVEDVSTLCSDMAIMGNGRVLLEGVPSTLQESLDGRLWIREIDKGELKSCSSEHRVIASHFHLGKLLVTVDAERSPGEGFEPKEPSLEDVYFRILSRKEELRESANTSMKQQESDAC